MTEEENKAIETLQYLCSDDCINKDIIKIIVNLIEKLQKENEELRNTKNNCPQFNTSGIKCKNKDIHCPTSKETLDYYENFLIPGYEEEIKKLQKEIEEKTIIIMAGAEKVKQLEKEFIIKQEVKENYIPKNKIREKLNQEYEEYTNLMKTQQSVETKNIWTYQHNAIKGILEELLEEE